MKRNTCFSDRELPARPLQRVKSPVPMHARNIKLKPLSLEDLQQLLRAERVGSTVHSCSIKDHTMTLPMMPGVPPLANEVQPIGVIPGILARTSSCTSSMLSV